MEWYKSLRKDHIINPSNNLIGIKKNPWRPEDILYEPSILKAPEKNFDTIRAILYHDMVSEYDARLFSQFIYSLNIPLSPEFRPVEEAWRKDEENHFNGFRIINHVIFGLTDKDLEEKVYTRKANFEPLKHLLTDEFSILLISAYDELCTVRGYSADIPIYDGFGTQVGQFIRRVISDEGWHYSKFLRMIRRYHSHRLEEVKDLVKQIRNSEGLPYQNTFIMDHVENVFTSEVFDESAKILIKALIK